MGFYISRELIYRNIANIWYQFRINGEITGNFCSSRGVRQGDPLSPLLFVLAQQIITFNLKKQIEQNSISWFKVGHNERSISHLFYEDDVLIFTNGADNSSRNLMQLMQEYERPSGQLIIAEKAGFICMISFSDARR